MPPWNVFIIRKLKKRRNEIRESEAEYLTDTEQPILKKLRQKENLSLKKNS
jgi:hypothetical protein